MASGKRAKMNIPVVAACVLLCLVLFSVHMTSGIFARYTAKASGRDSARVATFGNLVLKEEGSFGKGAAVIIPGVNLVKNATVSFSASEAAVYVFVEAELSGHWTTADNKTFAVKSGEKVQLQWAVAEGWKFLKNDGNKYVFYKALEPNTALFDEPFVAENGEIAVNSGITRNEIVSLSDIYINLQAFAAQTGTFSAEEIWNKIS